MVETPGLSANGHNLPDEADELDHACSTATTAHPVSYASPASTSNLPSNPPDIANSSSSYPLHPAAAASLTSPSITSYTQPTPTLGNFDSQTPVVAESGGIKSHNSFSVPQAAATPSTQNNLTHAVIAPTTLPAPTTNGFSNPQPAQVLDENDPLQ